MSGWLRVLGLGPGTPAWITPETSALLAEATDLIGYAPYLARLTLQPGQTAHGSDNRVEVDRAQHALRLAEAGHKVAVISGGDPGIFAMAAAVLEAVERGPPGWRSLDLSVHPGVSAMQAAAARLGAPLGHDFCVISLSDNLKPWGIIERRLDAVAAGDFVLALYNPASKARPDRLGQAFDRLRGLKAGNTPVAFARAIGRADESLHLTTLAKADPARVDMATLVLIGSSETRRIERPDGSAWLLTPRTYGAGR